MEHIEIVNRMKQMIIRRLALKMTVDEIDAEAPLFRGGLSLDSVESLEIVVGIEEEFGVTVEEDEHMKERFFSVNTLAFYVAERLSALEKSA